MFNVKQLQPVLQNVSLKLLRSHFTTCFSCYILQPKPVKYNKLINKCQLSVECFTSPNRFFHLTCNRSAKKNFYEVLGVSKNASNAEIKDAYIKLAKQYHPDKNKNDPNAQKKFQEVHEAYKVLSDSSQRTQYDQFGSTAEQMGSSGFSGNDPRNAQWNTWTSNSSMDPEEFFRKIFDRDFYDSDFDVTGGNQKGFNRTREITMSLTFEEAARGCNKEIRVNVTDTCPRCSGSKCEPGYSPRKCTRCHGSGMETISTGPFVMRSTCRVCRGARTVVSNPCIECEGVGSVVQSKRVTVPVPAGIENEQTVRISVGRGEVFVTFKVAQSDYFRRDGPDVHTDAKISIAQAVLGGTIRVAGVFETQTVSIPPGTSSHTTIRLSGQGLKKLNSMGYGDHYVHVKIAVPKRLSDKQKALLLAYAEVEPDTPGAVHGISYKKDGTKQSIEEPQDLLESIREAISENKTELKNVHQQISNSNRKV